MHGKTLQNLPLEKIKSKTEKIESLERALKKLFEDIPETVEYFNKIKNEQTVENFRALRVFISTKLQQRKIARGEYKKYEFHINNTMRFLLGVNI